MTWGKQNTEAEAHEQLSYAWDQGINFLDAAEMYPVPPEADTRGLTEKYIGSWLKSQKREDVVIASKVCFLGLCGMYSVYCTLVYGAACHLVLTSSTAIEQQHVEQSLNPGLPNPLRAENELAWSLKTFNARLLTF